MQRPSHLSVLPGGASASSGSRGGPQASIWMTLRKYLPPALFFRLLNLWPPYLGAGVRVVDVGEGGRSFEIELRLRWWNRNYVGVQFGGSLYSMCDPFFMAILMEALGPGYVVWDKAGAVRFLRPGRSTVRARF
jgi:acyl-coenzyme A thioesterase PaaI-like protein